MTDYRGLGFDPTPGDADAVAEASGRCRTAVDVPGVPDAWAGAAAEGLTTRLEAVVSELAAVRRAMHAAAEVLDAWAGALLDNRRRAEELDRRAVRLRRELADAADEVDYSGALASFTPSHAEAHAVAVARHDDLARRLEEVLEEARLLERDHHAEARRVADRLRSAERPAVLTDTLADFSLVAEEMASVLFGTVPTARRPDWAGGQDRADGRDRAGSQDWAGSQERAGSQDWGRSQDWAGPQDWAGSRGQAGSDDGTGSQERAGSQEARPVRGAAAFAAGLG